jgi:hypothetical protein
MPPRKSSLVKKVRRQNMATPIKEQRTPHEQLGSFVSRVRAFSRFFRKHIIITSGAIGVIVLLCVLLFSPFFAVTQYTVSLDKNKGCLTENYVREKIVMPGAKVWSYLFFNRDALYKKHQCLNTISFGWNPFNFHTISISVISKTPLARILVTQIDSTNHSLSGREYFLQQPLTQQIKYLTTEGALIDLEETVHLFQFRLLVLKDVPVSRVSISQNELVSLMQISQYFEDAFKSTARIDVTPDKDVRIASAVSDEVIFSLRKDISVQLGSLQALLQTSTIDKKKILSIDVRFGNPVVRFK